MAGISKIASNIGQTISNKASKVSYSIGNSFEKSPKKDTFSKFLKHVEPTGSNNAFLGMTTLMVGTVIVPRVLTASKRNPGNAEATKDEIKEILFRDLQTVLIVLFALKMMNSVIAGKATKMTGIPMTNKPYQKIFDTNETGLKGLGEKAKEFASNPLDKLKKIGKNIIDTIHPTGGVITKTNEEFVSQYSGYSSFDEIQKLKKYVDEQNGDFDKVFNKVMDSLIADQKAIIEGNPKKGIKGLTEQAKGCVDKNGKMTKDMETKIKNATSILNDLEELKAKGQEGLFDENLSENVKNKVLSFFKDEENALIQNAKGLNAILRTVALGIEASYLGFGLPALNQKRLEKKYLKEETQEIKQAETSSETNATPTILNEKTVKPQQVKVFQQFIK